MLRVVRSGGGCCVAWNAINARKLAAINVSLFKKLPYSPIKDFTPIGQIAESPTVLVGSPKLVATSVAELIRYGRDNPGKLSYDYGSGSAQVAGASFSAMADIRTLGVAYRGAPQVLTDVMSGVVDITFIDYVIAIPRIRAGKLKAFGVTSKERFAGARYSLGQSHGLRRR